MNTIAVNLTVKDWFIVISVVILLLCLFEIRKLKKIITLQARRELIPQLNLELILNEHERKTGFYLKNESYFLARDISIEDLKLILDDYGYNVKYIIKFGQIDYLKPQENAKLELKVFDKDNNFLADVTESIIPHLIAPFFTINVFYTNIENLKLGIVFSKKREKFYVQDVKTYR